MRNTILAVLLLAVMPATAGEVDFPGRCLTLDLEQLRLADPAALTAEQRALLDYFRDPPVLSGTEKTVATDSFLVHYTEEGGDAPDLTDADPQNGVPDYVDVVAEQMEIARAAYLDMGWRDYPSDEGWGGDARTDVFVGESPYANTFGLAYWLTDGGAGYMFIDQNLPEIDETRGESLFLRSVCTHELQHIFQFGYGTVGWYGEATATFYQDYITDVFGVAPVLVSYLLAFRFESPEQSLLDREGRNEYANCIWNMCLFESQGEDEPDVVREVWEQMELLADWDAFAAHEAVLGTRGTTLAEQYLRFTRWNYASCEYDDGRHYRLGSAWHTGYGSVYTIASHESFPASGEPSMERRPQPYGSTYVELIPDPAFKTGVFSLSGEAAVPWGVAAVGIPREEADYFEQDFTAGPDGTLEIRLEDWNRYQRIGLGVANLTDLTGDVNLLTGAPFSYEVAVEGGRTVDPVQTRVQADPATLPADGKSTARILITPRDDQGLLFGPGREVVIEAELGTMTSMPMEVEGGIYFQWYRAGDAPGPDTISATIDGVAISTTATIELTPLGDADSDVDADTDGDADTDADSDADSGGGSGCAATALPGELLGLLLLLPLARRRLR